MLEKKQKTNCEKARNLCLLQILAKLGHFPKKESEKEAWFLSPFRSETQASFKVNLASNKWMDFGEMKGGNVIDLICRIMSCSVSNALAYLNDTLSYNVNHKPFVHIQRENKIHITRILTIQHPALVSYLSNRKIKLRNARKYCKEIWYLCNDKKYFAIGLRNQLGGWELRNKFFKNCCSPKTYTYLNISKGQLIIVEGMFDLLALAELHDDLLNHSDIIVLNSIAFLEKIKIYLDNYTSVHLYLDNDTAGKKATDYLMNAYSHITDKSNIYKNYKDLNDFLIHGKRI